MRLHKQSGAKAFRIQSSISCALNELESEFQISLFERSNHGVMLTSEGRHFLSYAKSILERKEELENIYSGSQKPQTQLSISTQHYQCVADAFIEVVQKIDKSNFHLIYKESSMDKVINDVYNFEADIGIIITSNLTEELANYYLSKRNLKFHVITEIEPCAFMSKDHPLAGRKTLKINDLLKYPYITFTHSQEVPIDFSEGIHLLSRRKPYRIVETNDRCAMVNLLCNTNVVSTGSGLLVERLADSRLISVPLEDAGEKMTIGWINHEKRAISPECEFFLEELGNSIKKSFDYTKGVWEKSWTKDLSGISDERNK